MRLRWPAAFPIRLAVECSQSSKLTVETERIRRSVSPVALTILSLGILCFPPPQFQDFTQPGGSSFKWRTRILRLLKHKETTLNPRKFSRINFQSFLLQCIIEFSYKLNFSRLGSRVSRRFISRLLEVLGCFEYIAANTQCLKQ
jgi:hypothetical protein